MPRSTLFIDNGGYSVKALFLPAPASSPAVSHNTGSSASSPTSSSPPATPKVYCMPNCIGAAPHAGTGILGDQLERLPHYHGLMVRRPVDRGFPVDGALQARVWEHVLQHFAIEDESDVDVWLTIPFGASKAVAQLLWLLCTRSFRFGSITFVSSSFMSLVSYSFNLGNDVDGKTHPAPSGSKESSMLRSEALGQKRRRSIGTGESGSGGTAVLVDMGFSGTTIVSYIDFLPVLSSVVRLDIGGKLLTNRLKEFLSFSQVNVMEDTWLINHVREQCCVVALQPQRSLKRYAAMWRGKTREEVDAQLPRITTQQQQQQQQQQQHKRFRWGSGEGDGSTDGVAYTSSAVCGIEEEDTSAAAAEADSPVRFYLPTIPALLPLGVREAELPSRLPKSSAVDAAALQHLLLCHERFLIPELLFTPADVGVDQQGLTQAITEGIFQRGLLRHVATLMRPQLLHRVCVYGGTAGTPLLCARLNAEVKAASPSVDADETLAYHGEARGKTEAEEDQHSTSGLASPPHLPDVLRTAVQDASSSAASSLVLQPLLGAYKLLRTPTSATSTSSQTEQLRRLRALVQQRSTVELQHPAAGRVTVETLQEALRQML